MKRGDVPFDTNHFGKLKKSGQARSTEETFEEIYRTNHWDGDVSCSGPGSGDEQTREISIQIPALIRELGIKHLLDIPCGDFNWFGKMDISLKSYTGGDIIQEIINQNNSKFKNDRRRFIKIDLINDHLPQADILLCRDCLVHFSNADILRVLKNIKQSNINYVLTTTFTECDSNQDIVTGDWRIINLEQSPFNLPRPIKLINEKCSEGKGTYTDKCLGLWKIQDL